MTCVNILAGPPMCPSDDRDVVNSFLSLDGWHVVCGGSSSVMVSRCTGLEISLPLDGIFDFEKGTLPYGKIGDHIFATEGIITLQKVAEAFKNGIAPPPKTGEQLLYRLLKNCDGINIFLGCAKNPRHPDEISFTKKEETVLFLVNKLEQMGKSVRVYRK